MERPVFYRGGGFEVSASMLRTPRKTYRLAQIEFVSVQRPLLLFAGLPAIGTAGICMAFGRYLFLSEIITLVTLSGGVLAASLCFGVLRVHSLALRDDEVSMNFGPIGRLRAVRVAVEQAMSRRNDAGLRP